MFLVASNVRMVRPALQQPWACIGAGLVLLAMGMPLAGLSVILLLAAVVPLLELQLCFGRGWRIPERSWLLAAMTAIGVHAVLLAFAQNGSKGIEKLAVNFEYLGAVLAGTGAGALWFREALERYAAKRS